MSQTLEGVDRCPGCGSVVSDRFQSCRPVKVDVTQPGYRYLADTWGYCLHLGRHVGASETAWLTARTESTGAERDDLRAEVEALWAHIDSLRYEYEGKAANPSARFVRASDVVDNLPVRAAVEGGPS